MTRSAREDQAATVDVRARESNVNNNVNEREVYKRKLQTSGQRPSPCSKEGLWPW